jgi:dihydrofolate reductase
MGKIIICAAVADNMIIGDNEYIPWRAPNDLKRLRKMTLGHRVVMGRKTFESILRGNGRPLPDRETIVVSKSLTPVSYIQYSDVVIKDSLQFLQYIPSEGDAPIFILGGGEIYNSCMSFAHELRISHMRFQGYGNVYFPKIGEGWQIISITPHVDGAISYDEVIYRKTNTNTLG